MRMRHRIPTIFNLSMVDVLCCALGCFILLWVLNFREAKRRVSAADLTKAEKRLAASQVRVGPPRRRQARRRRPGLGPRPRTPPGLERPRTPPAPAWPDVEYRLARKAEDVDLLTRERNRAAKDKDARESPCATRTPSPAPPTRGRTNSVNATAPLRPGRRNSATRSPGCAASLATRNRSSLPCKWRRDKLPRREKALPGGARQMARREKAADRTGDPHPGRWPRTASPASR